MYSAPILLQYVLLQAFYDVPSFIVFRSQTQRARLELDVVIGVVKLVEGRIKTLNQFTWFDIQRVPALRAGDLESDMR